MEAVQMEGDLSRFHEILEEHRGLLLAVARSYLGQSISRKLDPEDLVQEVMQRAVASAASCRNQESSEGVKQWLIAIMANRIRDELRYFSTAKRMLASETNINPNLSGIVADIQGRLARDRPQHASTSSQLQLLAEAIQLLPPAMRRAIEMKYLEKRSLEEISEILGRSVPSVAGLLRRGLVKLREYFDE